ncbi:hypothetical protein GQ600_14672 [Phytophthora cactorum]|nr:hypothetical protein GQ600_14672 [Phytophthora cactorum]
MAPNYGVRNGVLMRRVYLKACVGPLSRSKYPGHPCHPSRPAAPLSSDVLTAHVSVTKTLDKVHKHAYYTAESETLWVRSGCTTCGSGKGYRPWRSGLMQKMPVQELSRPLSLLVVLLAIGEGGGEHFEGEERARLEGGDASANGEGERFYAGEHERFLVKEGGRTRFFEEERFWDGDAPSLFILLGDGEHSVSWKMRKKARRLASRLTTNAGF